MTSNDRRKLHQSIVEKIEREVQAPTVYRNHLIAQIYAQTLEVLQPPKK